MITLKNVSYTYARGTPFEKTALSDVTLSIDRAEFMAIVGSTGSGKSTLVQILANLLEPTNSDAVVRSEGTVGLVFQRPEDQLFEDSVDAEIAFAPTNLGCDPDEVNRRVELAMQQVGLPSTYRSISPLKLSGGERRRVAIASILSMLPDTLILDEPTAGLDAKSKTQLLDTLRQLNSDGTAIVMVTHDMDAAARLARRIIVMSDGRIVLDDAPRGVFQHIDVLSSAGVDQPSTMKILRNLQSRGVNLNADALNLDECEAIIRKCFKI